MKENVDKYLDDLTNKMLKNASTESPSFDFTDNVMSQISALGQKSAVVYKPLISKKSWFFIVSAFVLLIAYFVFGPQTEGSGWFSTIDYTVLTDNKVTNTLSGFKMSGFTLSKTLTYGLVLLGLMFLVQITMLKHNFDKRFEV